MIGYKSFLFILLLLCSLSINSAEYETSKTDFTLIMERIRTCKEYILSDSLVSSYMDMMEDDGSYPDIDYTITSRSGWKPQLHYYRIMDMSFAYINNASRWFCNEELYNKIVKGISFWLSANPRSDNWYQQQIDEPLYFGRILIAMRAGKIKLPEYIESQVIDKWRNNGADPAKRKSSNRAEVALHWMYFSCLLEDEDILETAMYYLFEPIEYTEWQGFQVDNSFLQHGPQLYIAEYGEHILESVLQAAYCVKGTRFNLPEEKMDLIRHYVLNTYEHAIRGQFMNWSCAGRTISRPDYLRDQSDRPSILTKLIELDNKYSARYSCILNRLLGKAEPSNGVYPYHSHLYRGDYTVHVRPSYNFSTRMVSTRTVRSEYLNGENLLTYFLSDGATEIKCSGDEYFNLMPLWDWNKIPGVTAPILDSIPRASADTYAYGSSVFVGGVSDSIYGCTAYKYFDDYSNVNTGASKGYFFFDDEVVCLGAGVTSLHSNIQTTINQCWGGDTFVVNTNSGEKEYNGNTDYAFFDKSEKCNWVLHNGIGYLFPASQYVAVENRKKTGNWRWISTIQEDKELSGKVFTLSLKHPTFVKDGKYSYFIIPNSTRSSLSRYQTDTQIEILTNTDSVQIVRHNGLNLIECVFYKPCRYISNDMSINSLQPSLLLIKDKGEKIEVHIADPLQSQKILTVGIQLKNMSNMIYGSCDYSEIEDAYSGMSKVMIISKETTSFSEIREEPIIAFSSKPYTIFFDRHLKGNFSLFRIDGTNIESKTFNSDKIPIPVSQKGLYLMKLSFDGKEVLSHKIFIK